MTQQPARYMKVEEVEGLTGKSYKTLWRWWAKEGCFPKPHKTKGGAFLGWPPEVYEEWLRSQVRG